jgi:hypothetical protein
MKKLLDSDALELSGVVANSAMNRERLIVCESRKDFTLNYQYLGADDAAGPNYTGQAAVNSHYDQLEV